MRANFVDRLLARVDGELATIWITALFTTDAPPSIAALQAGLERLVAETDRLRLRWDERAADWAVAERSSDAIAASVRDLPASSPAELTARLIRETIDLRHALPLRITVAPLTDPVHGRALVAVQLHHAVGDARSLMHLVRRLWELVAAAPGPGHPLGPARLSDRRALLAAGRRLRALPAIVRPEHRVLARRGLALWRRGDDLGAPMLLSLRVPMDESVGVAERSALFFGALLAAVDEHQRDRPWPAPIRLRVPVDLRRDLGIGPTLENACSAVPVEISEAAIRATAGDPRALGRLVPDALARLIGAGVHWSTLLECLAVSRFASTASLRSHVRPDLVAPRRASTLVTTYVGTTDRYFEHVPFPVRTIRTHTPTWGANGLSFGGALVVNMGSFEGLWRRDDLASFVHSMSHWLSSNHGLAPQVIE